jgi:hypothetical protein
MQTIHKFSAGTIGMLALLLAGQSAMADGSPAATAATQPPDKCQYTLFNPTPVDQMRGMDIDRPSRTNTPHTIDAGHLQVETGIIDYSFYRGKYHGANTRSDTFGLGQFNFRLGVLDNLEINAVINSEDLLRNTDLLAHQSSRQNGFGDTVVGATLNLWGDESGDTVWATALGIQPQFKIPTARENIGNGHGELFVGLPFAVNLPAGFHLGFQSTLSWERNSQNNGETTGWQNSIAVDRAFFDRFDVYVEYWSHVSTEHHQMSQQTINVGVTISLTDNLAVDTGVDFGLNRATTTIECLAGFSFRM